MDVAVGVGTAVAGTGVMVGVGVSVGRTGVAVGALVGTKIGSGDAGVSTGIVTVAFATTGPLSLLSPFAIIATAATMAKRTINAPTRSNADLAGFFSSTVSPGDSVEGGGVAVAFFSGLGYTPDTISPFSIASLSACAISPAVAKRSSGFFFSVLMITFSTDRGRVGTMLEGGSGSSRTWPRRSWAALSPSKGRRPVTISYSTTPNE